ncbi:MAG: fibronectin type III domain-containing protein [Limisphaerales bacterium]
MSVLSMFNPLQAATSKAVTLAWDSNSETDLTGYRLYYGTAKGSYTQSIDAGNKLTVTLNTLAAGNTYYFVVTAYNRYGLESLPSEEISHTIVAEPSFQLTSLPKSQVVSKGSTITLDVAASGPEPVTFQWHKNQIAIPGATGASYTITNLNSDRVGTYSVTVRDNNASVSTPPANVSSVQMITPKRLDIEGVPGASYKIAFTENLVGANWTHLTNLSLKTNRIEWLDASATNVNRRFYRLSVEQ